VESFQVPLPSRGGSVHAVAWGPADRPADIVFLHANGFNALTYRTVLEPLGADLRVLALDQRGHGLTTLPTETAGRRDWLDLRDDLVAVLSSLGVRDAVLSGHSMGGTVSILAAASHPSLARALVLFDPVVIIGARPTDVAQSPMVEAARRRRADFASRSEAYRSYRGRGAFRTWPDAILSDYLTDGLRDLGDGRSTLACSPEWEASGFAAHGHDTAAAIAALTRPTRILKAEDNSTCRPQPGDFNPPGGLSIEVVPGTTHFLPMERPELVGAALYAAATSKA
jgi:pimeloyl-ACP methyl ester carboxylesterase